MSPGHMQVSSIRLRKTAAELQAVADRLSQQAQAFQGEVESFGAPWGSDDIGMIIGAAHDAVFQAAIECFTTNAEEIQGRAEQIVAAAENHEKAEDANVLYVNRINELL